MLRKTWLLLIKIHRNNFECNRRPLLQGQQHHQHGKAILTATHAHQYRIAILHHIVITNRLTRRANQLITQLQEVVTGVMWVVLGFHGVGL